MPSTSKKQHNFMAAVAHSPSFAKKVGVPQSVGKHFNQADKGKTFKEGGAMKPVDMKKNPGLAKLPTAVRNKMGYMKKGGMADAKEDMKMDKKQDKAMIKKAFKEHDAQEHKGGKGTKLVLKKGGMACAPKKMATGGMAKETMGPRTMAMDVEKGSNKLTKFGESAVQKRGQTKGKNLGDSGPIKGMMGGGKSGFKAVTKMATGGLSAGHKSANGIARKGLTKGTQVKMKNGGKC